MEGNKDGLKKRCKIDIVKKYPELSADVWIYDAEVLNGQNK
jgi:hypothetical protein